MTLNTPALRRQIRQLENEISRLHSTGIPNITLTLKHIDAKAQTAILLANETKIEVQKLRKELRQVSTLFAALLKEQDFTEMIRKDHNVHK